jgi:hypothetical protein
MSSVICDQLVMFFRLFIYLLIYLVIYFCCIFMANFSILSSNIYTSSAYPMSNIPCPIYRKQNFWILYGDCLYFFRSKDDFDEWLLNPYLIKEKRAALVKRYLNFNDGEAVNFQVDKIGMKYYRKGGMMYHFKLDKMYIRGPAQSLHLVAAFSSMNESDVIELNTLLLAMLGKTTKSSSRRSGAFSETHSKYEYGWVESGWSETYYIYIYFVFQFFFVSFTSYNKYIYLFIHSFILCIQKIRCIFFWICVYRWL